MTLSNGEYFVVKDGNEPRWLRPVSPTDHGAVPEASVSTIRLLDIFEVDLVEEQPEGFHTENWSYVDGSIRIVRRSQISGAHIKEMISTREENLLGNAGKSLTAEEVINLDHSILLINPENFEAYFDPWGKVRARFLFRGIQYSDLKITDPAFVEDFKADQNFYKNFEHNLLTISLTALFKEEHWKLVAGVVSF